MMRTILLFVFSLFFAIPAFAQERLDGPMRAELLTGDELRFLQAALAYDGHYTGLLDGKWGPASQRAMNHSAERGTATWDHAARMARRFRKTVAEQGWQPSLHGPSNLSVQLPMNRMKVQRDGADGLIATANGKLRVRSVLTSAIATTNIHALIVTGSPGLKPDYSLVRTDRMVTATTLSSGRHTYARSEARAGQFGTVIINWDSAEAPAARLIIASIGSGRQTPLSLQTDGVLQVMIDRQKAKKNKPAKKPDAPVKPSRGALAGTAFYINNTDLVAASAALEHCGSLALTDGTPLDRIARFREQGLVLLTGARRSDHWLPLGLPDVPDAGDLLRVYRYEARPDRRLGLQARQGAVVTALKFEDRGLRLLIGISNNASQTGAPVLNAANHVVGVVVGPPPAAGASLLQQMGFATPAIRLASGLRRKNILFDPVGDTPASASAPSQDAIVPLVCR